MSERLNIEKLKVKDNIPWRIDIVVKKQHE